MEWQKIVEGLHPIWDGLFFFFVKKKINYLSKFLDISEPYKETIRAFLIYFNTEILKRSHYKFDWSNGSIGNFFFTGARLKKKKFKKLIKKKRLFFNSLETAIFWFGRIAGIPKNTHIIPIINRNSKITVKEKYLKIIKFKKCR